jgi:hypothetical protein
MQPRGRPAAREEGPPERRVRRSGSQGAGLWWWRRRRWWRRHAAGGARLPVVRAGCRLRGVVIRAAPGHAASGGRADSVQDVTRMCARQWMWSGARRHAPFTTLFVCQRISMYQSSLQRSSVGVPNRVYKNLKNLLAFLLYTPACVSPRVLPKFTCKVGCHKLGPGQGLLPARDQICRR